MTSQKAPGVEALLVHDHVQALAEANLHIPLVRMIVCCLVPHSLSLVRSCQRREGNPWYYHAVPKNIVMV